MAKLPFANTEIDDIFKNKWTTGSESTYSTDNYKFFDYSVYGLGESEWRKYHLLSIYFNGQSSPRIPSFVLQAQLPQQIGYTISSTYTEPLSFASSSIANMAAQMFGRGGQYFPSASARVSTLKMWEKSTPITLDLEIPLLDDGISGDGTNYMECIDLLSRLVLPQYDGDESKLGMYTPPPSPLALDLKYSKSQDSLRLSSERTRLMLQLGGMFLMDHCILESMTITYPNTKAQIRHDYSSIQNGTFRNNFLLPIMATLKIKISSVEGMTYDTFAKMIGLHAQKDAGLIKADLTQAADMAKSFWDKGVSMLKPTESNNGTEIG